MARVRIITVFTVALLLQLSVAVLDEGVGPAIRSSLGFKFNAEMKEKVVTTVEKGKPFGDYRVRDYFKSSTDRLLFYFSNKDDLIAEITEEYDKDYDHCKSAEFAKKITKDKKINYANKIVGFWEFKGKYNEKYDFYVCTEVYEKPAIFLSEKYFFSSTTSDAKLSNSKKIFRLIGKVIQSFAELNYKGKNILGSIKPEDIMVKPKAGTDIKDKEFDPIINYNGMEDYHPSYDISNEMGNLGDTIDKVLENNSMYFDNNSNEIKALKTITTELKKGRENKKLPESAPKPVAISNMIDILALYIAKMKECDSTLSDQLNKELHDQAVKELEALKKVKFRII